jgi:hypothetical protein
MECGVIAEGGWKLPSLSSQVEESEIMDQLLGTFLSSSEESHQELPWSIQASNASYFHYKASSSAYSSTSSNSPGNLSLGVPSESGGYYLSDSNEALGLGSCTAPLHLDIVQNQGVAQFMEAILLLRVSIQAVGVSRILACICSIRLVLLTRENTWDKENWMTK